MFNKDTLLILGAGASKDYGFPTGSELIANILKNRREILKQFSCILKDGLKASCNEIVKDKEVSYGIAKFIELYGDSLSEYTNYIEIKHLLSISEIAREHIKPNGPWTAQEDIERDETYHSFWSYFHNTIPKNKDKREIDDFIDSIESDSEDNNFNLDKQKYQKTAPKFTNHHINTVCNDYIGRHKIDKKSISKISETFKEFFNKYVAAIEFFSILQDFDPISIDFFLSIHEEKFKIKIDNNNEINIGKFAISYEICRHMRDFDDKLFNNLSNTENKHSNWYKYLLNQILEGHNTVKNKKKFFHKTLSRLKIITFNYDTSLECYLYDKLTKISHFDKNKSDVKKGNYAKEFIEKFLNKNIYHVYGKIDYNKFLEDKKYDYKFIAEQSKNILTINEERKSSNDIKLINTLANHRLKEYKQYNGCYDKKGGKERFVMNYTSYNIFIIGYGFNEANNSKIRLSEICGSRIRCNTIFNNRIQSFLRELFLKEELNLDLQNKIPKSYAIFKRMPYELLPDQCRDEFISEMKNLLESIGEVYEKPINAHNLDNFFDKIKNNLGASLQDNGINDLMNYKQDITILNPGKSSIIDKISNNFHSLHIRDKEERSGVNTVYKVISDAIGNDFDFS